MADPRSYRPAPGSIPTDPGVYRFRDEHGRVDFYFPGLAVVGEFDGKIKYQRFLKPGQAPADVVFQEKLREDRIRDLGLIVVRWTWDDLSRPQTLRRQLCEAFERGRRAIRLDPSLAEL